LYEYQELAKQYELRYAEKRVTVPEHELPL
jgi:hypothetical protein